MKILVFALKAVILMKVVMVLLLNVLFHHVKMVLNGKFIKLKILKIILMLMLLRKLFMKMVIFKLDLLFIVIS